MNRPLIRTLVVASTLILGSMLQPVTAGDKQSYFDLSIGGGMVGSPGGTVNLEEQSAFGLHYAWSEEGWPFHIVLSGLLSDEGQDYYEPYPHDDDEVSALELAAGVRKYWNLGQARPFAGLGVSVFLADRTLDGVFEEAEDYGTWIEGGIVWPFRYGHLGLSGRVSQASVVLHGDEIEGGTSIHVIWGSHW